MATFINENFVPDNPLLKMMKPLPADFNFGAAFAAYTDTLIGFNLLRTALRTPDRLGHDEPVIILNQLLTAMKSLEPELER